MGKFTKRPWLGRGAATGVFCKGYVEKGWTARVERYDDGGYSGASLERPAMQQLLEDVRRGQIDCVMVYKVDRLSRSLLDFARLIALFDRHGVSFVSVTQGLNEGARRG